MSRSRSSRRSFRAAAPEIRIQLSRRGVQRIETTVRGSVEDATHGRILRVDPVRHPAIDAARGQRPRQRSVGLRIELPEHTSGCRLECHHAAIRRRDVHDVFDHQRRALDRRAFAVDEFAGLVRPGDLQLRHILAVDIVQRRVPHPAAVPSDGQPVVARLTPSKSGRSDHHRGAE